MLVLAHATPPMPLRSARLLRRAYLQWVDDQIESYKESVSRSDLLCLADKVVAELRMSHEGQYQLTELLLMEAVDRKIFQLLKLPSYRSWAAARVGGAAGTGSAEARHVS